MADAFRGFPELRYKSSSCRNCPLIRREMARLNTRSMNAIGVSFDALEELARSGKQEEFRSEHDQLIAATDKDFRDTSARCQTILDGCVAPFGTQQECSSTAKP